MALRFDVSFGSESPRALTSMLLSSCTAPTGLDAISSSFSATLPAMSMSSDRLRSMSGSFVSKTLAMPLPCGPSIVRRKSMMKRSARMIVAKSKWLNLSTIAAKSGPSNSNLMQFWISFAPQRWNAGCRNQSELVIVNFSRASRSSETPVIDARPARKPSGASDASKPTPPVSVPSMKPVAGSERVPPPERSTSYRNLPWLSAWPRSPMSSWFSSTVAPSNESTFPRDAAKVIV